MAGRKLTLKKGEALMLRTCDADGRSYGGFQWPGSGRVSCPDWKAEASCGNGLHGLLWGVGDGSLLNWNNTDAKWLVVSVLLSEVVAIYPGKVKVPSGEVVYYGGRQGAIELIARYAPAGSAIVGGTATAGYRGTICIRYWNGRLYKIATFAVGEGGIRPNTPYRANEKGEPQEVKS